MEQRAAVDSESKMLSLTVSPSGAPVVDAVRTMRERGVGMTLLAEREIPRLGARLSTQPRACSFLGGLCATHGCTGGGDAPRCAVAGFEGRPTVSLAPCPPPAPRSL